MATSKKTAKKPVEKTLLEKIGEQATHLKEEIIAGKDLLVEAAGEKIAAVKQRIAQYKATKKPAVKKAIKKAAKKAGKKIAATSKKITKTAGKKVAVKKQAVKKAAAKKTAPVRNSKGIINSFPPKQAAAKKTAKSK